MTNGMAEKTTRGNKMVCVWRNLRMFCKNPYAKIPGMRSLVYRAAVFEISGSWWRRISTGSVKYQRTEMKMEKVNDMIHDAWRWTPRVRYSLAPNPWPHSVSRAPLRPICSHDRKVGKLLEYLQQSRI